ncbi:MAG: hypothetical protein KKI09_07375 [Spirochaetes bacterium]|nr:hypothetical protein [Spirochaetota bacterium]
MYKKYIALSFVILSLQILPANDTAEEVIAKEVKIKGSEILIPMVQKGDDLRFKYINMKFDALQISEFSAISTDEYNFFSLSSFFVNDYMMPPPFYYIGADYNTITYDDNKVSSFSLMAQPFSRDMMSNVISYSNPVIIFFGTMLMGPIYPIAWILDLAGVGISGLTNSFCFTFVWGDSFPGLPDEFYELSYFLNGDESLDMVSYMDVDSISFMDISMFHFLETPYVSLGYHFSPAHPLLGWISGRIPAEDLRLYGNNSGKSFFNDIYFNINAANIILAITNISFLQQIITQYRTMLLFSVEKFYQIEDFLKTGISLTSIPLIDVNNYILMLYNISYYQNLNDVVEETHLLENKLEVCVGSFNLELALQSRTDTFDDWIHKYQLNLSAILPKDIQFTAEVEVDNLITILPAKSDISSSLKWRVGLTWFY